jgi:hypothetical protein
VPQKVALRQDLKAHSLFGADPRKYWQSMWNEIGREENQQILLFLLLFFPYVPEIEPRLL